MSRLLLLVALAICPASAQVSNPVATDADLEPNSYRDSSPIAVEEVIFGERTGNASHGCELDLRLRWITEMGSGIYTSPVLADLHGDGATEILASTFTRYVEVVEGENGHTAAGWPFVFDRSSFHASPLLFDVDRDGTRDIVVATNDGEIVFLGEDGLPMHGWTLKVPPLVVRKNWYLGLNEDRTTRRLLSVKEDDEEAEEGPNEDHTTRRLLSAKKKSSKKAAANDDYVKAPPQQQGAWGGSLTKAGIASLDLLRSPEVSLAELEPETDESRRTDPLRSVGFIQHMQEQQRKLKADSAHEHVLVDAHIMATPAIADLDHDGRPELIATVSYYFDREETESSVLHAPIAPDVQVSKYVAGGVIVFQLDTKEIKWSQHLDLTTDTTKLRAYIYTSPTIADIDGDGRQDVVVGTSVGFIYVLDDQGKVFTGFPVQIGEIQGTLAVEDVTADGALDIIAADASGNVVCISAAGEIQWEQRISGFSSQGATIGDVDGDGTLDVVLATTTGHVWVLHGQTGKPLDGFPTKTDGKLISPVLLTQIKTPSRGSTSNGVMQLVVPSFDGGMYIFDGKGVCSHRVDIGESAYSQVLAGDVTGDGRLDLVVGTMAGNMYVFGTTKHYHPSVGWPSQGLGASMYTSKLWQASLLRVCFAFFSDVCCAVCGNPR